LLRKQHRLDRPAARPSEAQARPLVSASVLAVTVVYLDNYRWTEETAECVVLWRAVLYQAFTEACYQVFEPTMVAKHSLINSGPQRVSAETWRHAADARNSLLFSSPGLASICIMADIEPGYILQRAKAVIEECDRNVKAMPPAVTKKKIPQKVLAGR
jgi:hypothetical protein